jgi:hypothetical protein
MEVLVELDFKVHRGIEAKGAVEPHAVVKDFNPFKDGGARGKRLRMDQGPAFRLPSPLGGEQD